MIVGVLAGLGLFFPHATPSRDVGSGWRLSVSSNSFSAERSCTLRARGLQYRRRSVVFAFRPDTATDAAAYRVDGGPLVRAQDDAPLLAQRGFALSMDDLRNPSGAVVRIPVERLSGASTVRIDPDARGRPVTFRIVGLKNALDQAAVAGCDEAAFR